jgi:hypothetical protein
LSWFVHGFVRVVAVDARLISLNYCRRFCPITAFAALHGNPWSEISSISFEPWDRARTLLSASPVKEINMLKPYSIAVGLLSASLALADGAERKPKECEDATALEGLRESRIEAEFSRRGIFDPLEKINRRAEIESEIDNRIRIVKDICERLLGEQ